ncbi:hypothetical protein ARMSODRAFT_958517 [Armillaria solidipes]|uniref:Uncharacterized protein n=1 Tax=Armillaria solidipes TaxID=1076256 RepID=A0A2H3BLV3_9AGAR|nr:hypothetical protein ARMSODRAFT_958517 [Armillaria solidipes]
MISSLEINLAMRRAFTNLYQKRETKAETYEGETVKSQVSSLTTAATKSRPNQEKKESIAGRAPSPETGHRYDWNQAVLATLRYSTSTVRMGL